MATTEELLTTLVELKKEELRRARVNRTLTFVFATLPLFIILLVSIYAGVVLARQTADLFENLPQIVEDQMGGQVDPNLLDQLNNYTK